MLKNIKEKNGLIRFMADTPDPSSEPATTDPCAGWHGVYSAQSAIYEEQKAKYDEAVLMIPKYEEKIKDYKERSQKLEELGPKYTAFQGQLNEAWGSNGAINGYENIQKDIDCFTNFNTALGTLISQLEAEKTKWETQRDEAEDAYKEAERIMNSVPSACRNS